MLVRSKPARLTEAGTAVVRMARQVALLEHDTLAQLGAEGSRGVADDRAARGQRRFARHLVPRSRSRRLAERHPVVFELHRDDQDFTAGLLESGTVMGAVTSRSTPVAGCRVSALGAMRYEAVATPAFVATLAARSGCPVDAGAAHRSWTSTDATTCRRAGCGRAGWMRPSPPRHYVPASNDFAAAVRLGIGWGLLPRFQSQPALAAGELVHLGGPPIDVPLYWQQWNLRSPLLDAIADEIVAEGRRVLVS